MYIKQGNKSLKIFIIVLKLFLSIILGFYRIKIFLEFKMTGMLPRSFNDWFSWSLYEKLPKSGNGTDIFLFGGNPLRHKFYCAWHLTPQSVYAHTRRYRLVKAICEKDINELKTVLDEGYDPNTPEIEEKYRYTALGLAASLNRVGIIEYLLLRGGNIDAKDPNGNTPLMHAVVNWQFDSIKFLVERGANINITDKYGFSAIQKARFRGLSSIAKYLEQQSKMPKKKEFPPFKIEFGFEEYLKDVTADIYKSRKYYDAKPKVYPFNNFEGTYSVSFVNYKKFE